jgi:hypothetical protein
VYLGFSYHNLSSYFDDYIYGETSLQFFDRYIDILDYSDYFLLIKNNPRNIAKMGQLIIRNGITSLYDGECAFLGKFPDEKMVDTFRLEQCKKRIKDQYYQNGKILPYSEINIKFLIKIITFCNEKHLKLVVLNTPQQKNYFQLIPENYIEKYKQIVNEYKLNVYNFNDMTLPDSCFLPDGDHINYNGTFFVSKKFKEYHEKNMNQIKIN